MRSTSQAAIPRPADTILFAEGMQDMLAWWGCGVYASTEVDWCWGTMSMVYADWLVNLIVFAPPGDTLGRAWRKHTGSSNVAFADGHVKSLRPNDLNQPARWLINLQQ